MYKILWHVGKPNIHMYNFSVELTINTNDMTVISTCRPDEVKVQKELPTQAQEKGHKVAQEGVCVYF